MKTENSVFIHAKDDPSFDVNPCLEFILMKTNFALFRMLTAGCAVAAMIGCLTPAGANGAIVFTDGSLPLTITAGQQILFDLDRSGGVAPYARSSPFVGMDFFLGFGGDSPEWPTCWSLSPGAFMLRTGSDLSKLAYGDVISSSQTDWSFNPGPLEGDDTGVWNGTEGSGYLGLRLENGSDFFYGWALIDYFDSTNTMVLKSFAIETIPNQAITAGAVPETDQAVALSIVLAGSALLRSRRRVDSSKGGGSF